MRRGAVLFFKLLGSSTVDTSNVALFLFHLPLFYKLSRLLSFFVYANPVSAPLLGLIDLGCSRVLRQISFRQGRAEPPLQLSPALFSAQFRVNTILFPSLSSALTSTDFEQTLSVHNSSIAAASPPSNQPGYRRVLICCLLLFGFVDIDRTPLSLGPLPYSLRMCSRLVRKFDL